MDRRARPRAAARPVRREPAHHRAGPAPAPLLGERWRIGTALFEVTAWRIPCANFARFWDVPDLVKRFAAHGATGAYLRVLETGDVGAGDAVEVVSPPDHGITVGDGVPDRSPPSSTGCPNSRPPLIYLPVKDQPKVAAASRSGWRAAT